MSKRTLEKLPTVTRAALAAAASCLFALVLCLLFAAAASSLDDPTAHLSLYGEIIFAVTMLTCGLLGAKLSGDERFLSGMLSGGILLLFVIAASFAFPGGSFAKCAVLCGIGAFLVSVGALLGAKEPKLFADAVRGSVVWQGLDAVKAGRVTELTGPAWYLGEGGVESMSRMLGDVEKALGI